MHKIVNDKHKQTVYTDPSNKATNATKSDSSSSSNVIVIGEFIVFVYKHVALVFGVGVLVLGGFFYRIHNRSLLKMSHCLSSVLFLKKT